MSDDLIEPWNPGGTAELLRYFQEKSEDIEKVVIPQTRYLTVRSKEDPRQTVDIPAALIVHWTNGRQSFIPNKADAEVVLNDGILNRMKIRIEIFDGQKS